MGGDEVQSPELLALCDGGDWLFSVSNKGNVEVIVELTTAILEIVQNNNCDLNIKLVKFGWSSKQKSEETEQIAGGWLSARQNN
jgi:hypothetical protein